jgi:isopropylmalate/homocitrate/citramalate synthase
VSVSDPNTPWHTENWFTSPWNHDPEVAATWASMPDEVFIHDVTLRDGEQQAGVMFTTDDKVRIAEKLSEAGVHRIEAGLPAVSEHDEKAVKAIAKAGLPSKIYAFSRCMVPDVQKAIDCGVDGVVIEIPSSRHLIELGYRWSVERAIELSIESTRYAHENGLEVSFFPIDATRASLEDYLSLIGGVAGEGHMDALVLVDTMGVLTPHAVERFTSFSKERFDVPLETHFHMDYGLAVANSLIAVGAGAQTIQTTIGGIGERAGNCPMEEAVMALLTLYDRDIGIDTTKLTELHRFVMELAGVTQPVNRSVTGERLFAVESGIIATWVRNVRDVDIVEAVPYAPSLVGQTGPHIVLGKGSGLDSIAEALEASGLDPLDEDAALELLMTVKNAALDKRDLLDLSEFQALVTDFTS